MQDTRDSPSTTIDGIDTTYRAEPTLDAQAVREPSAAGTEPAQTRSTATEPAQTESTPTRSTATEPAQTEPTPTRSTATEPTSIGTSLTEAIGALGNARSLVGFASGSPFVAAIAAIETVIATVLLGVPLSPAPAVVGLVAFAVYTVDHVADAAADARSTPERARIARRYADQLMVAAALAYGLAVALSTLGGPVALGAALLPGAFWIAYASDWLPNVGRAVRSLAPDDGLAAASRIPRLKEVPVVSSVVVATGWAIAVTLLPLSFADAAVSTPTVAVAFAYFLLRSFVDTELPNVRDVAADAAAGVATLPIVLGVVGTRRVLYAVDLATAATLAAATVSGALAPGLAAALGVGLAASIAITALAGRVDADAVLGVAPDCSYLVVALALAVVAA